jgi:hypothetical protein
MLRFALLSAAVLLSQPQPTCAAPLARLFSAARTPLQLAAASNPDSLAVSPAPVPVNPPLPPARVQLRQSIQVEAASSPTSATGETAIRVTSAQMQNTAGTLDDPTRYFQVLPGVHSDTDQRNDFLVRGGNPAENLFVLDGIEVPSINHLALSDTTGGLVSMIDADAIESMTLHAGVHDARFDDRLSSVVEISTTNSVAGSFAPSARRPDGPATRRIAEVGIGGLGGVISRKKDPGNGSRDDDGRGGAVLLSVRQGILDLVTNDIGLNGVPKYTNALLRGDRGLGSRDQLWGMSLTGVDSIAIHPASNNSQETVPFDITYRGWRNTTGANWQHLWSAKTFGVLTLSNAEQAQHIVEDDQLLNGATTYAEDSHDGNTTGKYELTSQVRPWLLATGGGSMSVERVDYALEQPVALPSPYSDNPAGAATSINADFSAPVNGGFALATFLLPALHHPNGLRLTGGTRVTHWGFNGRTALSPRAIAALSLGGSRMVSAGFAEYSQMPAYLYLLAFPQNHGLSPIAARHLTLDLVDLVRTRSSSLQLSAYDKRYRDYPVAAGFQQLSLANIADTFGQSFPLFPMTSQGRGRADGVEATVQYRAGSRLTLRGSAAYARCLYSGMDGVLRPGNYDVPFSARVSGIWSVGRGFTVSARYDGSSGRPYTPDNMPESYVQNRDVYNLQRINAARSPMYARLDFRVGQTKRLGAGTLAWHAGLENATNRRNFYGYVWQPHAAGTTELDQMPRFPDGGIKYTF